MGESNLGASMSTVFKQAIENIKEFSPRERALVTHCLISSLETEQEQGADEAWGALSKSRLAELESGAVKGVSWEAIKNEIKG